jgi:hypothetical protein
METPVEAGQHLNKLHEAVWQLAAISLAFRDPGTMDPDLRNAADHVVAAAGLGSSDERALRLCPGLAQLIELLGGDPTKLASQSAAPILQAAALLSGATEWMRQDDEALLAQGRASAQGAGPFKMFAVPMMEGLGELLAEPSPIMLDVGVGVGAMAVAWCQTFPGLHIVGVDVFPRALELASRIVAEADLADRIELRDQDVIDLDDRDIYCYAWLPAPFLPPNALEAGVPRILAALVPGGWVGLGHGKFGADPLSDAITRLQTVAFGGTALDNEHAELLLRRAGFESVTTLPTPQGAPGITVGRRPAGPPARHRSESN